MLDFLCELCVSALEKNSFTLEKQSSRRIFEIASSKYKMLYKFFSMFSMSLCGEKYLLKFNFMKIKSIISTFFVIISLSTFCFGQIKDFTKYVNPFVGTGGHGHTFPGATVPFGAVQLSPDTRIDNWDGSSGYHYSDNEIFGFSHTHLSGTGIPDYCDILVTPRIDGNNSRTFSHQNETATAGYYSVKMDNGIFAEMTATQRVGLHRYTFPDAKFVNLDFNLKWRDKVLDSQVKIVGKNRIEGYRRSSSWARDQIIYFVAEFSEPFVSSSIAVDDTITERSERLTEANGTNLIAMLRFDNSDKKPILVKVGISAVDIEGAIKNLNTEVPHWSFEKVRTDAKAAWNRELSKIEVSGGTDDQLKTFYSALYHVNIQPNVFSDVDGRYRGIDKKIYNLNGNPKSKIQNPKITPFFRCGIHFVPRIRFTQLLTKNGRRILSTPLFVNMNRADDCLCGNWRAMKLIV